MSDELHAAADQRGKHSVHRCLVWVSAATLEANHCLPAHAGVICKLSLAPAYESARAEEDDDTLDDTVISEASRRKGRTSMPSWDEIVFGARTDD